MQPLKILILFVMLVIVFRSAWSQNSQEIIPPITSKTEQPDKHKDNPNSKQSISEPFASTVVNTIVRDNLEIHADQSDSERYDEPFDWSKWLSVTFAGLVVVVAILSYRYQKKSWHTSNDLVEETKNSTRISERAYVKMSHTEAGIEMPYGYIRIKMKIENFGNTPADIIDILMCPIVLKSGELLPEIPPYKRQGIPKPFHAYLIKNDHFFHTHQENFKYESYTPTNGETLYIIGYVDYVDKFSMLHRFGYARLHNYYPRQGECNLAFVNQAGYNYDKECGKYEGGSSQL